MRSHRILFIGNSHTYLHYMPRILVGLAEYGGHEISADQATGEGASLQWHWSRRNTEEFLAQGGWTHVVLQERSRGPLEDQDSMLRHSLLLDRAIRGIGARTVFYMTWAARDAPGDQKAIASTYEAVAQACGAMLAPVGLAWMFYRNRRPKLDLYHKDGRHASKAGAYLSACVFYALLFEISPLGLTGCLEQGGRLLADIPADEARALQQAAYDAVHKHLQIIL